MPALSDMQAKACVKKGFSLLELLVALAVFSILVVLLMSMVDTATKLWRTNENRIDSYREARAVVSIVTRDLQSALAAGKTNYFKLNDATLRPNGSSSGTNASQLFFLSTLPGAAQWSATSGANKSDLCQVGYFLGFGKSSASSNSSVNTMNLYRYFLPSDATYSRLTNNPSQLFPNTLNLVDPNVELLARNIVSFQVNAYNYSTTTNTNSGVVSHQMIAYTPANDHPLPDLVEVTIQAVNQETSARLTNAASWSATNSSPIVENIQTFKTRIHLDNKP